MSQPWATAGRTTGRQWLPVDARIPYRFLVTYRAPADELRRLVPAPLELDERAGLGFLSVCALRLEGLAPLGWPRAWAFDTPEFLIRLSVTYRGEPTFFTLASWVASRRLAWLSAHFSHYRPAWADFTEQAHGRRRELRARADDGSLAELDAEFSADDAQVGWPSGSVFSDVADAEAFLLGMAGSVDVTSSGAVRFQPITRTPWRARPVHVHTARFDFIDRLAVGAELDHALGMSDIEQRWERVRPW
ncbi:MAG TPA: DUF2071 domain-containing protein [Polyangiaceae bacterium]|nr:DUF2071 domain-containing protein [Polyangiaceae bacterium]